MLEGKSLLIALTFCFSAAIVFADPGLICLANGTIDPSVPSVMSIEEPVCSPSDNGTRLYIVQPEKNFIPSERETVKELGIRFQGNIPPNAYILEATEKGIADLKAAFSILYVGEFLPEYKLLYPGSDEASIDAEGEANWKHVQVGAVRKEYLPAIIRALDDAGAQEIEKLYTTLEPCVKAYMTNDQAREIAKRGDVAFIEPYSESKIGNDYARSEKLTNVDAMQMEGYTGKGQMICIQDSGLDNGTTNFIHPDFLGKKIIGRTTYSVMRKRGSYDDWCDDDGSHGTHVAGSALGTGKASDGQYRGMACDADIYFLCAGDGGIYIYPGNDDDLERTYSVGCRVMNNSWYSRSNGQYTSDSRQYDQFVWDHKDYTVCFCAGNDNKKYDLPTESSMGTQGSAKNVITVGASMSLRYNFADVLYQGLMPASSRGPCQDGRIKPDVVAPGTVINSTLASRQQTSVRDEYYCLKSGTSMASPIVAGSAAIIREYLIKNRQETSPSAALVKAILCTGANSLYPGQDILFDEIPISRPNSVEGHGQINVKESLEPTDGKMDFAEMSFSQSGQSVTKTFNKPAKCNLNVGLVWTDYPGSAGAAQALVNDLDLYVVAPDGKTYTLDDHVNNVEVIRLYNVPAGEYKVTVKAKTLMEANQPCAVVFHYRESDQKVPLNVEAKPFGLNSNETQWILQKPTSVQTINYTAKLIEGADKFTITPTSGRITDQASITIKALNNSSKRGYDWGVIEIDCGDFGKITKCFGRPTGNKDDGYVLYESKFSDVPDDDLLNYDSAWKKTDSFKITAKNEAGKKFMRLSRVENSDFDDSFLYIGVPEGHSTNLDLHVSAKLRFHRDDYLDSVGFYMTQYYEQQQFRSTFLDSGDKIKLSIYDYESNPYLIDQQAPMDEWITFDVLLNLLPSKKILREITFYNTTKVEEGKITGRSVVPPDIVDFWNFEMYSWKFYVDISDFTVTLDPPTPEPGFLALITGLMLLLKKRI